MDPLKRKLTTVPRASMAPSAMTPLRRVAPPDPTPTPSRSQLSALYSLFFTWTLFDFIGHLLLRRQNR